jgi:hypothetical protein
MQKVLVDGGELVLQHHVEMPDDVLVAFHGGLRAQGDEAGPFVPRPSYSAAMRAGIFSDSLRTRIIRAISHVHLPHWGRVPRLRWTSATLRHPCETALAI